MKKEIPPTISQATIISSGIRERMILGSFVDVTGARASRFIEARTLARAYNLLPLIVTKIGRSLREILDFTESPWRAALCVHTL